MKAVDPSVLTATSTSLNTTLVDNTALGTLEMWSQEEDRYNWGFTIPYDGIYYKASDGKLYNLATNSGVPFVPAGGGSDKEADSKVDVQVTESGGKLVACCHTYDPTQFQPGGALYENLRYGVWIAPSGEVNRFVVGTETDRRSMQGASWSNGYTPKGKATYEVMAFRTDNGNVYASRHNIDNQNLRSRITVNFNSNQVGGTILGNADFGSDINFTNVNVSGTTFSGGVESGGQAGTVRGSFYGDSGYYIGGLIDFTGNSKLNAVFGGATSSNQQNSGYSGSDTTPIDK